MCVSSPPWTGYCSEVHTVLRGTLVPAALVSVLAAAGCLSPAQMRPVERSRERAALLLDSLGQALRAKEPGRVRSLLPPGLDAPKVAELERMVGRACWLSVYSGYSVDSRSAAAQIGWRDWRRGRVRLSVPGSNARAERFNEEVRLVLVDGRWYVGDLDLAQPVFGAELDPPAGVKDDVRKTVERVFERLKSGNSADIYYNMLPEDARFRYVRPGLWGRLIGRDPKRVGIYEDLKIVEKLDFQYWPDPNKTLPMAHVAPGRLAVVYDLPYLSSGSGAAEPDELRLELVFQKGEEGWKLVSMLLAAQALR